MPSPYFLETTFGFSGPDWIRDKWFRSMTCPQHAAEEAPVVVLDAVRGNDGIWTVENQE